MGVSGGVDSSVALYRLKKQGYDVVAVFIKTWQPDFIECTWKRERLDAMRVAAYLDVPFITFDATNVYKTKVAEYMIQEYREGRTPNPDVMCNEYVKFGVFFEYALSSGADKVATGHYAQIETSGDQYELHRGADVGKDQSYFLWKIPKEHLSKILFPIGDSLKSSIRSEATRAGLPTSSKKDSQGVCFLGEVDMAEFLSHYIPVTGGGVYDINGTLIGRHHGASLYTQGQRHGFSILTKGIEHTPMYVTSRDIPHNTITVSTELKTCDNVSIELACMNVYQTINSGEYEAQFRYRQKPFRVQLTSAAHGRGMLRVLDTQIDLPSLGQSCVLYRGTQCIAGGIINSIQ